MTTINWPNYRNNTGGSISHWLRPQKRLQLIHIHFLQRDILPNQLFLSSSASWYTIPIPTIPSLLLQYLQIRTIHPTGILKTMQVQLQHKHRNHSYHIHRNGQTVSWSPPPDHPHPMDWVSYRSNAGLDVGDQIMPIPGYHRNSQWYFQLRNYGKIPEQKWKKGWNMNPPDVMIRCIAVQQWVCSVLHGSFKVAGKRNEQLIRSTFLLPSKPRQNISILGIRSVSVGHGTNLSSRYGDIVKSVQIHPTSTLCEVTIKSVNSRLIIKIVQILNGTMTESQLAPISRWRISTESHTVHEYIEKQLLNCTWTVHMWHVFSQFTFW